MPAVSEDPRRRLHFGSSVCCDDPLDRLADQPELCIVELPRRNLNDWNVQFMKVDISPNLPPIADPN
jgi:hypothetical protein